MADVERCRHDGMEARLKVLRTRRNQRSSSRDPDHDQTSPPDTPAVTGEPARKKTTMEQWLEPTVRKESSYQDHGGTAYGVLEHMQPLGELPNAKVKARVKPDGTRKSVLGRSSAAAGHDAQETPEGTPTPTPVPFPPVALSATAMNGDGTTQEDQDDDYAPRVKKPDRAAKARATKARRSEALAQAKAAAAVERPDTASATSKLTMSRKKVLGIVESAKARALKAGKPELMNTVHEIWLQSANNPRLNELLLAILSTHASPEENVEFQIHVKEAKRRLKEKAKSAATPRELPAIVTTDNGAQPLRSTSRHTTSSTTTVTAPSSALPSTERLEPAKAKLSLKVKSPKGTTRHRARRPGSMSGSASKIVGSANASDSDLTEYTTDGEETMNVDEPIVPTIMQPVINDNQGGESIAVRSSLAPPDRGFKRSSAEAKLAEDEHDRNFTTKKRKLQDGITQDRPFEESNLRTLSKDSEKTFRLGRPRNEALAPPRLQLAAPATASVGASRAASADLDSPLSELGSPLNSPHLGTAVPKLTGKKAKTKISPEKRQTVGYNGLSGVGGGAGRGSPIRDDDNGELSDHNDTCSACGGCGFLLCCDGCDRAFHFECLDPPVHNEMSALYDPWYCFKCIAKRPTAVESPQKATRGLFAPLLSLLKKSNPSNFSLPLEIKDFYEGVDQDKHGAFRDAVKSRTTRRGAHDEVPPDYYRTKDEKGNTVICFACNTTSGHRPIVPCDFCGTHWHLDCLDPPLANPPARYSDGKKQNDWLCPLHVDHELRRVDTSMLVAPRRQVRIRRPKNVNVVDTSLTRSFQNNGIIDIREESSDDSESEFYDEDTGDEGKIHRMPATGIRLDFIDKIKSARVERLRHNEHAVKRPGARPVLGLSALEQANFAKRPFLEKQLALNLTQFASINADLELGKDRIENLVGTLIAEAPPNVVDTIVATEDAEKARSSTSAIPPSPPASEQQPEQLTTMQRQDLMLLQELIRRKLEASKT